MVVGIVSALWRNTDLCSLRLILEGIFDVPMILPSMMPTGTVDCGTTSSHDMYWRYGSAECRELSTISSLMPGIQVQHSYRISQIKEIGFRRGKDGLFAIIEGRHCIVLYW